MTTTNIFLQYRQVTERLLICKRDLAALKREYLVEGKHSSQKRRADLEFQRSELELERTRLNWQIEDLREVARQDKANSFASILADICRRNGNNSWVNEANTLAEDWITSTGRRAAYDAQL